MTLEVHREQSALREEGEQLPGLCLPVGQASTTNNPCMLRK